MSTHEVPQDWYVSAYPPEVLVKQPWAQKTGGEVDRLIGMLQPTGAERILDLGCGTGRHAIELARRGFSVVGVELIEGNIEVARATAAEQSLEVEFVQADLRELTYEGEFDLVLSLNDGAIGYFENEAENLKTFSVIARALRAAGRHLVQIANSLHAEKFMPMKTWVEGDAGIELLDHRWNSRTRCVEGATVSVPFGQVFENCEPILVRKRLYSVEELEEIYASLGMTLTGLFRGSGRAGRPRHTQFEIFTIATKRQNSGAGVAAYEKSDAPMSQVN